MEPSETNLRATLLERRIHDLRGHNVMLDHDLAALYAVEVKVLNQAVRRKYSGQFKVVFEAIRQLMAPPPARSKVIGFRPDSEV